MYWATLPRSILKQIEESGIENFEPYTVPDEELTAVLDGRAFHGTKVAALRHYRSQVDLDDGGFFASMVARPEFAIEHYLLVRGDRGPGTGHLNRESDLFAGLV